MKIRITEYLEVDLDSRKWCCQRCGQELVEADQNYKKGCLVAEKPLHEVYPPPPEGAAYGFAPNPDFCRIVEFYCPSCGAMIENEYLPPGHPITHDIELDIDALIQRHAKGA